ncbi:glutamate--tRNA ligase [Thermoactinomyces sp. DSM 45892]|uniref:glutamate--tRNA ligase n=1 Tax=Thermoactinomyces sp. DSM 45892 TaxID=1882753 RepID=UPI000898372B|nr:glutamate--tRNA ligase [Thermoactinomyces sp. DSM 45892]SDY93752.1 glutamyl-tRNA synthetase /glutamate--tRNA(Gln) ligase [Thermoactinomyces sp. DSM 45892]
MTVRTRYAPSPTGYLHIGGARTALFSYLFAKKNGGQFILRIEDTDTERNIEGADLEQMNGLEWLGVIADESTEKGGPHEPYRCMQRLDFYTDYANRLVAEGKAYYSYANQAELEQEREEQLARGEAPKFSGWDRHLSEEQITAYQAEGRVPSIRLAVPQDQTLAFSDYVRGDVEFDSNGIGDFIIVRPDGRPTYNFAVVIDDALMNITHVIRGEEHISNTPRQLCVAQALGFEAPKFAHIPLILNHEGKKMSKRDESIVQFISQYRDLGYLPEAIVNFLALLGWSPEGEEEIFSLEELTDLFSLERVSKSPATFDTAKLKWMNNYYIKKSSLERITDLAIPYLEKAGKISSTLDPEQKKWITRLVGLYQEQMDEISQIVELSDIFFRQDVHYSSEAEQVLAEESVLTVISSYVAEVQAQDDLDAATVKSMFKAVQKETGFKGKQLFMPVRAVISGETHGPDLTETILLLGKDIVVKRLQSFVDKRS